MAATFDTTEQRILKIIDDNRETIVEFARDIYDHAELGYKEFRTSKKFVDFMKSLQLPVQTDLAITGAKAYLNKEKAGNASLALIGELDALRIPQHAHANQETQAAHCCGHHAQLAGVIGAALALTDAEVAQKLDGQVIFFATPAEEYGEIEFKNQLIADGRIAYGGGKCELIRIGAFDDVDVALAHHISLEGIRLGSNSGGSTDVGDVQHLLPVITFNTGGAVGGLHQVDFDIVDEEEAYVLTAKIFALSAYRMLKNGAEVTKRTKQEYHPRFADKQEYIAFMDSFNKVEEADIE